MFPGIDPKKMQKMMKQMGIAQDEIDANRVIIECDDRKIIINEPSVVKINMQGQENFQISGEVSEIDGGEEEKDNSEDDIQIIIDKVGCNKEEAVKALEDAKGDLTEALLALG